MKKFLLIGLLFLSSLSCNLWEVPTVEAPVVDNVTLQQQQEEQIRQEQQEKMDQELNMQRARETEDMRQQ